jgi:hypothetical protein
MVCLSLSNMQGTQLIKPARVLSYSDFLLSPLNIHPLHPSLPLLLVPPYYLAFPPSHSTPTSYLTPTLASS